MFSPSTHKQYGANVNQALLQTQMDAIVSRKRLVNGVPTSLADLGYTDVGLDDDWQACGSYGVDKFTYHDESGVPQVNTQLFPDMAAMTAHGHALNLTVGWCAFSRGFPPFHLSSVFFFQIIIFCLL